ncbi:MAG: hypothetical protein R3C26_03210 [Calditrichia bacterium]
MNWKNKFKLQVIEDFMVQAAQAAVQSAQMHERASESLNYQTEI